MHHRYESQPFQIVRQINNFSPTHRGAGLRQRSDFNNIPSSFSNIPSNSSVPNQKLVVENIKKSPEMEHAQPHHKNRTSYLNAPIRKIWESDWTLLIPETHKENGSIF